MLRSLRAKALKDHVIGTAGFETDSAAEAIHGTRGRTDCTGEPTLTFALYKVLDHSLGLHVQGSRRQPMVPLGQFSLHQIE